MLLEGISEAIEQGVSLAAVMWLIFTKGWQSLALSQLIQPASPPRATFKHSMEIGACDQSSMLRARLHPTQLIITA